jgi:uncharacterized protein
MSNPRKPFRINVGFIVHEEIGFNRDFPFAFDRISLGDDFELEGFDGLINIGKTPQGLIVTGEFSGSAGFECVRCLNSFGGTIRWSFTELYAFDLRSVTDSGLILPEDAQLDLAPIIGEYGLLEIPISPLCKPDCRGLCPECGENLNTRACGHRPAGSDSAFAVLKDLL